MFYGKSILKVSLASNRVIKETFRSKNDAEKFKRMRDELAIEVDFPCSKDELKRLKQLVTIGKSKKSTITVQSRK